MKNRSELESFIIDFVKKTTGEKDIDITSSFMDYGMVSMTISALAGEITDEFCFSCDPAMLYEHPNIQSACNQLWDDYSHNKQAIS